MSGRLIYLMGPSGSGKDSLLNAARERLAARGCVIARRVITRSAEAVGEEAVGVSPAEFDQQEAAGAFALSWRANGLAYGIPRQIDDWLTAGQDVLVNGSRAYLSHALQRYPDLIGVLLSVEPAVLRERLLRRGRESIEQIEQRLARNAQFDAASAERDGLHLLDNSASIERAGDNLLALIGASRACA
ncbi:phosphonate metabolism protein/1,5-bisphosphokinase (PRPP-forming) PhnN [Pseudomonas sp. HMWF032]|uniref:phosphonate metabolism protein/1,5-bisphosphokinase (PRPP-forming) PhnN n=1 Tax=Pseudomonas sp. HMWF032 TaxID=2056866 RepID=UPI000D3939F8|nr:phosphonate metabolism protein/1,5-bisphosphokinase (PRPP-forming) PhnN [Pseudomonas sp. HMWF032]PTS82657.1 phosphonate metabolism protein/1,5-bisphosphokinase (PRPP-forming) PhnN [Pseudomonas sp. HMWF032]PTT82889.1 phosphonate metabolism protein/1,5-bisphosphokinase (PRPP-forming) PhnN [Pseudomonas sp. HMWF010]